LRKRKVEKDEPDENTSEEEKVSQPHMANLNRTNIKKRDRTRKFFNN